MGGSARASLGSMTTARVSHWKSGEREVGERSRGVREGQECMGAGGQGRRTRHPPSQVSVDAPML